MNNDFFKEILEIILSLVAAITIIIDPIVITRENISTFLIYTIRILLIVLLLTLPFIFKRFFRSKIKFNIYLLLDIYSNLATIFGFFFLIIDSVKNLTISPLNVIFIVFISGLVIWRQYVQITRIYSSSSSKS